MGEDQCLRNWGGQDRGDGRCARSMKARFGTGGRDDLPARIVEIHIALGELCRECKLSDLACSCGHWRGRCNCAPPPAPEQEAAVIKTASAKNLQATPWP